MGEIKFTLSGTENIQDTTMIFDNDVSLLGFLDVIGTIDSRDKILLQLWERLQSMNCFGFSYTGLNRNFSVDRFSNVGKINDKEFNIDYDDILFWALSQDITNLSYMEAASSKRPYLFCPVYGPYSRNALFIIHSPQTPYDSILRNSKLLELVLQKIHIAISSIEARDEESMLSLSKREIDVLAIMSAGRSNREIADILGISIHTVNGYIRNIMLKMGTNDRLGVCLKALSIPTIVTKARQLTYEFHNGEKT